MQYVCVIGSVVKCVCVCVVCMMPVTIMWTVNVCICTYVAWMRMTIVESDWCVFV